MAVPVVESSTTNEGFTSGLVLTKPSGVATGDLLLILLVNDNETSTAQWDNSTNKPTGFTFIKTAGTSSTDVHAGAFYRIADGTEGSTVTCTTQSSRWVVGYYIRVSGAHDTAPLDTTSTAVEQSSGSTCYITGLTTGEDDCLVFYLCGSDGSDTLSHSVASPFTESAEEGVPASSTGGCAISWGTREVDSAASGYATVTLAASDGSVGFQFSIAPADAALAITPTGATVTVTPGSPTFTQHQAVTPTGATVTVTPGTATVVTSLPVTPTGPTVTVTPGVPSLDLNVGPAGATVTVTPGTPSFGLNVAPTGPTVTVTPGVPSLDLNVAPTGPTVTVTPGTPSLDVHQPIAPTGPTVTVTPGTASLGLNVTVTGATVTVTPGTPSVGLTIGPTGPTVTVTPGVPTVTVGSAAQAITPTAPTVTVTPGVPTLDLTVAPTGATVTVTPGTVTVIAFVEGALGPLAVADLGSPLTAEVDSLTGPTPVLTGTGVTAALGAYAGPIAATRLRSFVTAELD